MILYLPIQLHGDGVGGYGLGRVLGEDALHDSVPIQVLAKYLVDFLARTLIAWHCWNPFGSTISMDQFELVAGVRLNSPAFYAVGILTG